jgi:hypothetical protein
VAAFTTGGWRLIAPAEGMSIYVKSAGSWGTYRSGAWEIGSLRGSSLFLNGQQFIGNRAAAIASPTGGTTIDSQVRATVDQILAALRQHGLIDA